MRLIKSVVSQLIEYEWSLVASRKCCDLSLMARREIEPNIVWNRPGLISPFSGCSRPLAAYSGVVVHSYEQRLQLMRSQLTRMPN